MTWQRLWWGFVAIVVGGLVLLATWSLVAGGSRTAACRDVFSAGRCERMAAHAAESLGVTVDAIAAITVIPRDDRGILQTRSGGPPVDTRITLADGSTRDFTFQCGGLPPPSCQDDP